MRFGAVWVISTHYVRFDMWFQLPLSKKYFKFLTKKWIFRLKPHAAPKFEENRDPLTLRNRKLHMKPHLKGIVRRIFSTHTLRRDHLREENPFYRN